MASFLDSFISELGKHAATARRDGTQARSAAAPAAAAAAAARPLAAERASDRDNCKLNDRTGTDAKIHIKFKTITLEMVGQSESHGAGTGKGAGAPIGNSPPPTGGVPVNVFIDNSNKSGASGAAAFATEAQSGGSGSIMWWIVAGVHVVVVVIGGVAFKFTHPGAAAAALAVLQRIGQAAFSALLGSTLGPYVLPVAVAVAVVAVCWWTVKFAWSYFSARVPASARAVYA